jgi:hypothetical protein
MKLSKARPGQTVLLPIKVMEEVDSTDGITFEIQNGHQAALILNASKIDVEPVTPVEPTGLGAVVDISGVRYIRTSTSNGKPWYLPGDGWYSWELLCEYGTPVVLNEGFTDEAE